MKGGALQRRPEQLRNALAEHTENADSRVSHQSFKKRDSMDYTHIDCGVKNGLKVKRTSPLKPITMVGERRQLTGGED